MSCKYPRADKHYILMRILMSWIDHILWIQTSICQCYRLDLDTGTRQHSLIRVRYIFARHSWCLGRSQVSTDDLKSSDQEWVIPTKKIPNIHFIKIWSHYSLVLLICAMTTFVRLHHKYLLYFFWYLNIGIGIISTFSRYSYLAFIGTGISWHPQLAVCHHC